METERDLSQNDDGSLALDRTLRTLIEIALTTRGRANPDDHLQDPTELGGWWGDAYPDVPGRKIGSRLWTLWGLHMDEALPLAGPIALAALRFMVEDGLIERAEVSAEAVTPVMIGLRISIVEPGGKLVKYVDTWEVTIG